MAQIDEDAEDRGPISAAPDAGGAKGRGLAAVLKKAVVGAFWTVATSIGSRVVGVFGTLAVTHYLDPEDYGEVSLAAVVIMTANAISNCGLSQYIVSKPNAGRQATFHATFYFLLLGAITLGITLLGGTQLGRVLNAPDIPRYLPGLALAALLERVSIIQDRILLRDMRFRSVGIQRSIGELAYTLVSVGLAAYGWGAMALVWGSIARMALRFATLSFTTPWREWIEPCKITWAHTRELFAFGLPMSVASLAGFGSKKWDNFIFARHFGPTASGFYNLAYNLADIPATQLGETIGDVLVPSFAKIESDEERKKALLLSMRMMILLVAPLAVGLAAVSPSVVSTMFPRKYQRIGEFLLVLSVLSVVRPIGWIGTSYLQVKNMPRTIMILEVAKTAMLIVLMYGIAKKTESTLWTCAAVGVAFAINSFSYMWIIRKIDGISLKDQILPLLPPILACIPMVAAILGARYAIPRIGHLPKAGWLAIEITVGAIVFVPSALAIAPAVSQELLGLIKGAISRRRGAVQEAAVGGE